MNIRIKPRPTVELIGIALTFLGLSGCQSQDAGVSALTISDAIERYRRVESERYNRQASACFGRGDVSGVDGDMLLTSPDGDFYALPYLTLGMMPQDEPGAAAPPGTQPSADGEVAESPGIAASEDAARGGPPGAPAGYWRKNIWHQMGYESKGLITREFWRGFKTSFWDVENALLLTAAMGASVTIRETGVDNTVRNRVRGHQQLGSMDEPLQLLCHPGTHFAGAGVLWLTSYLTKDVKQHEFAQALTEALAVNGVTTLALKVAVNTRAPDNEPYAWPSGHTSSVFTVAAVVNEFYGPWAGVPALALAGVCGYQRLDSRVHDFSDVVFGAMLGYVVGTSIARDEKAEFPELWGMKVIPYADPETGATGLALMKSW